MALSQAKAARHVEIAQRAHERPSLLLQAEVSKYSCGWLVDQLRRFPQWGSPTLQGYLMSAAAMWARAADTGFASVNPDGRVEIHLEKVCVHAWARLLWLCAQTLGPP